MPRAFGADFTRSYDIRKAHVAAPAPLALHRVVIAQNSRSATMTSLAMRAVAPARSTRSRASRSSRADAGRRAEDGAPGDIRHGKVPVPVPRLPQPCYPSGLVSAFFPCPSPFLVPRSRVSLVPATPQIMPGGGSTLRLTLNDAGCIITAGILGSGFSQFRLTPRPFFVFDARWPLDRGSRRELREIPAGPRSFPIRV